MFSITLPIFNKSSPPMASTRLLLLCSSMTQLKYYAAQTWIRIFLIMGRHVAGSPETYAQSMLLCGTYRSMKLLTPKSDSLFTCRADGFCLRLWVSCMRHKPAHSNVNRGRTIASPVHPAVSSRTYLSFVTLVPKPEIVHIPSTLFVSVSVYCCVSSFLGS
jgi:hypothetical protein